MNTKWRELMCTPSTDMSTAEFKAQLDEELKKIFKVIKSCDRTKDCDLDNYKIMHGEKFMGFGSSFQSNYAYITGDGMIIVIKKVDDAWMDRQQCAYERLPSYTDTYFLTYPRGQYFNGIFVDVNGKRGPNVVGRDLFAFDVDRYGNLKPGPFQCVGPGGSCTGYTNNYVDPDVVNANCSKDAAVNWQSGQLCSAKIIHLDNWEMKY